MTIYITVSTVSKVDYWDYSYDDMYDILSIERVPRGFPQATLQGAYNLIIDIDTSKIISYFEAVTVAGPCYWVVTSSLQSPKAELGRLSLAHDIDDGQRQVYFTDPDYTMFYTRLGEPVEPTKLRHIAIGKQVIVDITQDGMLAGVWMLDLPPEIGQKHAAKQKMEE